MAPPPKPPAPPAKGAKKDAAPDKEEALWLEDTSPATPIDKARAATGYGDYQLAVDLYSCAIMGLAGTEADIQALRAPPGAAPPAGAKPGDKNAAAAAAAAAAALGPDGEPEYPNAEPVWFLDRAHLYLRTRQFEAALKDANRVINRKYDGPKPPDPEPEAPPPPAKDAKGAKEKLAAPADKSGKGGAPPAKAPSPAPGKKPAAGSGNGRSTPGATTAQLTSVIPEAPTPAPPEEAAAPPPPPPPPPLDGSITAEACFVKGCALSALGRPEEAEAALRAAAYEHGSDPAAGERYRVALAERGLERALDDPSLGVAWGALPVSTSTPPAPRSGHALAPVGHRVYVWGGLAAPGERGPGGMHYRPAGAPTGDVELHELNTETGGWRVVPAKGPKPSARHGHTMAAAGGERLVVFGGEDVATKQKLGDTWVFHIPAGVWIEAKYNPEDPTSQVAAPAEAVPPANPKRPPPASTRVARPPAPRAHHVCGAFDGTKVVVFGGLGAAGPLNDTHVFDAVSMRWSGDVRLRRANAPEGAPPRRRAHAAACVVGAGLGQVAAFGSGKLYVFGGFDGAQRLSDLHSLDLATFAWEQVVPRPPPPPPPAAGESGAIKSTGKEKGGKGEGGAKGADPVTRPTTAASNPPASPGGPASPGADPGSEWPAPASPVAVEPPGPCGRLWASLLEAGRRVVVFGGYGEGGVLGDLWQLDTRQAEPAWTPLDAGRGCEPPTPRQSGAGVRVGSMLLLVGGLDAGKSRLADVAVLELAQERDRREDLGDCDYSAGDHYTGEWLHNERHGRGTQRYPNGDVYEGEWVHDARHGEGVCHFGDGSVYEGLWAEGLQSGEGTCTYPDGARYVGSWLRGKRDGHGVLTEANGDTYIGPWKDGNKHGLGRSTYGAGPGRPHAEEHEGEWVAGLRAGHGRSRYANGDLYEGEYVDDRRHGQGQAAYRNGARYDGEWAFDRRNGKGTCIYPDGSRFVGKWINDTRNGDGTMAYASGEQYKGRWKDDMREGQGVGVSPDGSIYEGAWLRDAPHGRGKRTYRNGDEYEGEWAFGARSGRGTCKFAGGELYDGEWKGDVRSGRGTSVLPDGQRYEGEWKEDCRDGLGTCNYADGAVYEGNWRRGVRHGRGRAFDAQGSGYMGDFANDLPEGTGTAIYATGDRYDGEWRAGVREGTGVCRYADGSHYQGEWRAGVREGPGTCRYADGTKYEGTWVADEKSRQLPAAGATEKGPLQASRAGSERPSVHDLARLSATPAAAAARTEPAR